MIQIFNSDTQLLSKIIFIVLSMMIIYLGYRVSKAYLDKVIDKYFREKEGDE